MTQRQSSVITGDSGIGTVPTFSPAELKEAAALIGFDKSLESWRRKRPSDWYRPSFPRDRADCGRIFDWTANQLAFHQSTHKIRGLFTGNGFGKSTAIAAEANAWALHTNQWQETPSRPVSMLWFCKLYEQFALLKTQLDETIFGDLPRWSENQYTWPDGSKLTIGSADNPQGWKKFQGIPLDLCVFDEEPPIGLYREMKQRSRGKRKTKIVFGATATEAGSWMEKEIYEPWLEHHKAQGLDIRGACEAQDHPTLWVWPCGGVADGRENDQEDIDWYESQTWSSPKEKEVRLHGGFQNWVGDPVFDPIAIQKLSDRCRVLTSESPPPQVGMFELDPRVEARRFSPRDALAPSLMGKPVTSLTPQELRDGRFKLGPAEKDGCVRIYVPPAPGQTCVIGADFALGLEGRDLDTAVVLDKSVRPYRHMATAAGRWGEVFDRVLYALAMYYGKAFILGESQVGLPSLRRLISEYRYGYLYYRRDEANKHRAVSDKLGHPRVYDDITMRKLRRATIDQDYECRDDSIIDQMMRLKYHSRTELTSGERGDDFRLKIKVSGGGSPDLVMAKCYARHACDEVEHFIEEKPMFEEGSMGAALGYEALFRENKAPVGISLIKRPKVRR